MNDHEFERAWVGLAREGSCDEPGGAEYTRVKKEWIAAGRPKEVSAFIIKAANRPSPTTSPTTESPKKPEGHVKKPDQK